MRTIDILGIMLKDYSLRESLKLTERYMKNGAPNVIVCVSQKRLMQAAEDERLKNWIEQADLTICSDPGILDGGKPARGGQKDSENHEYLHEFLKKTVKNRCTLYLLADSEERVRSLQTSLLENQSGLNIAGSGILTEEDGTEAEGNIVNAINDVAPGIIVAQLPFRRFGYFVENNKMFMNANIILELPEEGVRETKPRGFFRIDGFVWRKMFRHKLKQYNNQEKAE